MIIFSIWEIQSLETTVLGDMPSCKCSKELLGTQERNGKISLGLFFFNYQDMVSNSVM